jgi:hypothetical protein
MAAEAPKVYAAIAAVMAHMSKEGIGKDRQSGDGGGPKFKFRGIDDIYNALSSVMSANKLMMLPRVLDRTSEERPTRNGGVMFYTTVKAEFDLVSAEDGSKHTVVTFGEAMDSSDKSTNKAMSAAFKYAAMQAFCIPTEGDNDADSTTHEVVVQTIDKYQVASLEALIEEVGADKAKFLAHIKLKTLEEIPAVNLDDAVKILRKKAKPKPQADPVLADEIPY